MALRFGWLCVVAVIGCGRIGFDDARGDFSSIDATPFTCPPFALFCEDFESGGLGRWDFVMITGPSTAEVSRTRVHNGEYALRTSTTPSPSVGTASPRFKFPARASGTLAVRVWISLATPLENFDLVLDMRNSNDEYTTAGGDAMRNWVATEARVGLTDAIDHHSMTTVAPLETWTCVELVYTFETRQIELFIDDRQVLDVIGIAPTPVYSEVGVGTVRSDEMGFQVFQDDIIIADRRIGCR